MPRTALIIAVPEAEPVVGEWRERYDNARLGVPAHVTLLFPFVALEKLDDALLAELRELFASQPAFSFSFPIEAEVGEVTLLVEDESGRWRSGHRFALRPVP